MSTSSNAAQNVQREQALLQLGNGYAKPTFDIISFAGADRAKFLHNFCTANVKELSPGSGTEAFVLNVKGKIIGFGYCLACDDEVLFFTAAGQAESLIAHFDRYIIREDVRLSNRSSQLSCTCFSTSALAKLFTFAETTDPFGSDSSYLDHEKTSLRQVNAIVVKTELISEADRLLVCEAESMDELAKLLGDCELAEVSDATFETCRIENGTPIFGSDISETNLPQELRRDKKAISFTKGCYLGQETIARIDALGHVNKFLVQIKLSGESIPTADNELFQDSRAVGKIKSACFSPKHNSPIALAYVKRGLEEVGTELVSENETAVVI